MKKFIFEILVRNIVFGREWLFQSNEDLAEKISITYFIGKDEDEIIDNYIFVASEISRIRDRIAGRDREIGKVNLFVSLVCEHAAYLIAGNERIEKKLIALTAKELEISGNSYSAIKLKNLMYKVQHANTLLNYFENNYSRLTKSIDVFNDEYLSKGQTTNEVFSELLNLRKYGVKSSAFKEGIVSAPNDYWIYNPADFLLAEYDNTCREIEWQSKKMAAQSAKKRIASITVNDSKSIELSPIPYKTVNGIETHAISIHCMADFALDYNGELCIPHTHIEKNLRSLFEVRGHLELYELIRANAIFRLYDLIVPAFVNQKYSVPRFSEPNLVQRLIGSTANFNPMLYLKRVRTLFDKLSEIKEGLEREVNESLISKPSQALKREADIICHIRKLPEGYKASEKARTLAKEVLNYELKVGETFVCNHLRNKGGVKSDELHLAVKKH